MRMGSSSSLLARNFQHYNPFGAKPVFRKREKTPQLLINADIVNWDRPKQVYENATKELRTQRED
jgi:hypothetical protein